MQITIPLEPGGYYHIYNRGNNRENLFHEPKNYDYFINLYIKHIVPIADTMAYCLLKNHFHLLVQIKYDLQHLTGVSKSFSNFFNAYARSFNHAYGRTGALFQRPFSRIPVTSDAYFVSLISYIHQNPQKHGLVQDFRDWPYSSYHTLLTDTPTYLNRDKVLEWLAGAGPFSVTCQASALVPEDED